MTASVFSRAGKSLRDCGGMVRYLTILESHLLTTPSSLPGYMELILNGVNTLLMMRLIEFALDFTLSPF